MTKDERGITDAELRELVEVEHRIGIESGPHFYYDAAGQPRMRRSYVVPTKTGDTDDLDLGKDIRQEIDRRSSLMAAQIPDHPARVPLLRVATGHPSSRWGSCMTCDEELPSNEGGMCSLCVCALRCALDQAGRL